jgi:hypothetical protein
MVKRRIYSWISFLPKIWSDSGGVTTTPIQKAQYSQAEVWEGNIAFAHTHNADGSLASPFVLTVNDIGAFFNVNSRYSGRFKDKFGFAPASKKAAILTIYHELGHILLGPVNTFERDNVAGGTPIGALNDARIMSICGYTFAEIDADVSVWWW